MENSEMEVRPLRDGQEAAACALVSRVFGQFVAPLFPPEGVEEFLGYVTVETLAARRKDGNLQLAAWRGPELTGYLEMREGPHLALLFVDSARQRRGIGRQLLARGLELWPEPGFSQVTVNSSPNSVEAYQRLGFQASGEVQSKNGISFVPMHLEITQGRGHT
ncbi:MAG: GNAT family N-acetyltransferase [Desulfarculaceae bacterium]|nr:GNAT family N-acetyltransferase [Desulfarculaceae bacterium]MCF8072159.1 GNAT family N-acetyltransferase [Desulfarculaceae bacterium]MCF8100080.1 GNAT family N-acetyltransferase [Desulfarculaceae bacterium]MCF8118493.1 GNAT family N-acetyltransferase [Desulfarculaceae bacterium]